MNNTLTASRMNSLMHCPRQHFWSFEIGLHRESAGVALRFGSAWHRAMEARWNGASYEEALAPAIPEGIDLGAMDCATLAGLLAGYYDYYGPREDVGKSEPEQQFDVELCDGWRAHGKIDNLGLMNDDSHALVESKTTSDSVDANSDYWLRLRFNLQVFQYFDAAKKLGYDVSNVYYDVTRKPVIRPLKSVPELDKQGRKIVVDKNGQRVYATKTENVKIGSGKKAKVEYREVPNLDKPVQSASAAKGYVIKCHAETPDEFCDRLWRDTVARPAFYFCRKEIPILEDELEQFQRQRLAMVGIIEHLRSQEGGKFVTREDEFGRVETAQSRDPEAWPRNVSTNTCNFCAFKSFCLSNNPIDINNPPEGYYIKINPELNYATNSETAIEA